ncbi:hypothetical protein [Undibacterium sp.]|uniref:hypothetical protein n=1 Tax=Undibacterium sp. TaxID=1914977 RepID=UPI003751F878
MNTAKIEELKKIAASAAKAYNAERDRLAAIGLKSKERYELLKPLKAIVDATHSEYSKYAKGQINCELVKIIEADRPRREAEARSRSTWKMAKYNAAQAMSA